MSLNYCEENTSVISILRMHCYHLVKEGAPRKDGTRRNLTECCWCEQEAWDEVLVKHGPHIPKET